MAYVRSLLQLELPRDFVQLYIFHYWIFVFDLCLTVNLILEENRRIWFDLIWFDKKTVRELNKRISASFTFAGSKMQIFDFMRAISN